MGGVVSGFFQLVLGVPFKLTPDAINKGLGVSKIFLKEDLKLWPRDQNVALVAMLVLGQSNTDSATEQSSDKRGTIHTCGT